MSRNPLRTAYLKMRHFARETTIKTTVPIESLHRMRVALVKKAAEGFEAANLRGETAAMPGGGQNALQSDLRYHPRTGNCVPHSGFSALSTWCGRIAKV